MIDETRIRQIMREEIAGYMNQKQFENSKIPVHRHDGNDTVQINENDLIPTDNYTASLVMGNAGSEVFTISKIPNFNLMTFYGVATNGAYGGGPYNEKALITGEARVGKLYEINTANGTDFYSNGVPDANNYYQICTATYTNITDLTKQYVHASKLGFAQVWDGTSNVITASITNITNTSIEITVTVTASWYIQGFLFLS